jgi:hypothetical protein
MKILALLLLVALPVVAVLGGEDPEPRLEVYDVRDLLSDNRTLEVLVARVRKELGEADATVVADERASSLVVRGPAEAQANVRELLALLRAAGGQLLIEPRLVRGDTTVTAPSVVCTSGNLASLSLGHAASAPKFGRIGREEFVEGIHLEIAPRLADDGKHVFLDLDVRISERCGEDGFVQLRRRATVRPELGETASLRLGSLPRAEDGDLPLTLELTAHRVEDGD